MNAKVVHAISLPVFAPVEASKAGCDWTVMERATRYRILLICAENFVCSTC